MSKYGSKEHRQKIADALRGRKASRKTKHKLSIAQKGRFDDFAQRDHLSRKAKEQFSDPIARATHSKIIKAKFVNDPEYRRHHAEAMSTRTVHWTKESRAKISRPGKLNPFFGKHHTESSRRKLSETLKLTYKKGRKLSGAAAQTVLSHEKDELPIYCRGKIGYARFRQMLIRYESSWEESFIQICNKAKFVKRLYRPRGNFGYEWNGKSRHYFPDFVIELQNGFGGVVEIKPKWALPDSRNQAKFYVARIFLPRNFLVISEKVVSKHRLRELLCSKANWKE